jgi:hypothetical protein
MTIRIYSYKKAQVFKKDFVRLGHSFLKFEKETEGHKVATFQAPEGTAFDARGSRYRDGVTRWDATKTQSWAKFTVNGSALNCFGFDGEPKALPNWIEVIHD